ncbi:hypothetical protein [Ignavigranum ruoffiae]|uniref:hypothetical protein n=1 Tax=Ignavigranum ruoffiae TaxID=89093 RepID=UPI0024AD3E70|nr:hypothetical protein [Ignavigranum ruoffiae]
MVNKSLFQNISLKFIATHSALILIQSLFFDQDHAYPYLALKLFVISLILSLTFALFYPYLWQRSTWPAWLNILIASLVNWLAGILIIYLLSDALFQFIQPYLWLILVITLILHSAIFYAFSYYQNQNLAKQLNKYLSKHKDQ